MGSHCADIRSNDLRRRAIRQHSQQGEESREGESERKVGSHQRETSVPWTWDGPIPMPKDRNGWLTPRSCRRQFIRDSR